MPLEDDIQAAAADALTKTEGGLAAQAVAAPAATGEPVFSQAEHERYPSLPGPPAFAGGQQQQPSFSEADIQAAAADALQKTKPREIPAGPSTITLPAKQIVEDIAGRIPAGLAQAGAAAMGALPPLQGMPLAQVQATRDNLQRELNTYNEVVDGLMKTSQPDEGFLATLTSASHRINSLEQWIGQADDVLATHRPLTTPAPTVQPIANALGQFAAQVQPKVEAWADSAFPTNHDYANSLPGQIEQFGADGIVLGGAGLLLGPVGGVTSTAAMIGSSAFQDFKKAGATDEDAERGSLMTSVLTAATMPVLGAGLGALGRSFTGLSAKEGVNAIVKVMGAAPLQKIVGGGTEMALLNLQNDAIAKLSGYDPNRKMGATFWQNFWMGSVFGALHSIAGESPRLAQFNNPDVKVRVATPAEPPAPAPAAAEARPEQPVAAPAAAGAAPVVAPADTRTSDQKWSDFVDQQTKPAEAAAPAQEERRFVLGAGAEPVFTGEPRPERPVEQQVLSLGAPSTQTLEAQGERPQAAPAAEAAQPAAETPRYTSHEQELAAGSNSLKEVQDKIRGEFADRKDALDSQKDSGAISAEDHRRASNQLDRQLKTSLINGKEQWNQKQRAAAQTPEAAVPPWYEGDQFAARQPVAAELPSDRRVTPDDVKAETQAAQEKMGMHDNLVYTPTADDLPQHVKEGMNPQEMNGAQVVTDRKLGNVHVIGDRFSTVNELRRAIIEETLPYRYRNVSQLGMTHDATSNDLGNYDHIADRPVLNTHALLRSSDPYTEAAKTAMEEVNVHQGISRLLGPREGIRYVNAMNDIQAQFNRLQLNDILAQQKGYENADAMAAAYKVSNWQTDPRQAHKMTEELVGAYSRTFKTPEELVTNAPNWYQLGLRNMATGIRRFLGLRVDPYDVQSLINDSAAALRAPKWGDTSQFHPIGDAAKAEMQNFQFANRPPPVAGEEGAAAPEERADISGEMIRWRIAQLERALQKGQQLRTQPIRLAMQQKRTFQERMNLLNEFPAVISRESHIELMQMALDMFREDFGGDPNRAMSYLIDNRLEGGINPAFTEVTNKAANDEISALRDSGRDDQANLMAARLDRMNKLQASDVTQAARETAAQRLRHIDGAYQVAHYQNSVNDTQTKAIQRRPGTKSAINNGKDAVDQVTQDAANTLRQRTTDGLKKIASKFGTTMSLPEQYTQDLVDRIHDAMFKTNAGFTADDTPVLQRVYDTFRNNIQQIINERKTGVPTAQLELQARPKATDTLRTIVDNYPYYKQAWARTMDMLYTENPELAQRFARSIEEPVGETLANKLAAESGQNLSDLVYNHYSTNDRINTDLATKIMRQTGITGTVAQQMSQLLQNQFSDIVRDRQQDRLQSILNSVGGTKGPARGELNRLVDHIVIGGLDSDEWRNLVAPRFGIEHTTPEQIAALRSAGDYMSYLRDNGLSNSHIAQEVRQQMGDIMKLSAGKLGSNKILDQLRYISDVYAASLLTGPLTHAPYWQQMGITQMINSVMQGARAIAATNGKVTPEIALGMGARMLDGFARGANEFLPILQQGIKPAEEFMPQRGGQPLYRGALEKGTDWFSNYKYVRNALDAISNLAVRGSQYATHHALAMKLAWEDGLSGQDAWDAAEKTVLGTPEQQASAVENSHRIVDDLNRQFPDHPVNENYRKMLEGELLDQYKTTSLNPDSTLNDTRSEALRDIGRRAMAPGLRGALRGDVAGFWGKVSRGMLDFAGDYAGLRPIAPFLKVPFNLVNEHLSWGPLGIARSLVDLVPPDSRFADVLRDIPGLRGGIRGYIGSIPGVERMIETGEISENQIRDFAWEQMLKGIAGSAATGLLYGITRSMLNNPNAPIRFTLGGPSDYGQQEIERDKGWQPNSVYFAGAWHSYENTPWRPVFAGVGALSDYFRYEKQQPDAGVNELLAHARMLSGAISSMFGSPLQGPTTALQFVTSLPSSDSYVRTTTNFISQALAAGLTIPVGGTGARQIARLADPTQYESNTPWGKFLRYVPVVNAWTGQPKLNVFGEHMYASPLHNIPEYTPTGGLFGIPKTGQTVDPNDPVWNYLAEHPGLHLTMPGNNASVAHIKMTPEEIYVYHRARGPYLKQEIAGIVDDPHFAEMPAAQQQTVIHHVFEHAANQVGARAVMDYRDQHPVTQERFNQMLQARGVEPPAVETAASPPPTE